MSLVCVASQKGSPGVTVTALALAVAWQRSTRRRALLLEADPAGGTLAIRYRLGVEPGLLTLAAAVQADRHREPGSVLAHAQRLPGGMPAVVGPDGPDQARAALRAAGDALGVWLRGFAYLDVIADVGRLDVGSPADRLAHAADVVLMVARPRVEQLQPAARRLSSLDAECRSVAWILIGEDPYPAEEVEAAYGYEVAGVVADDPRAVAGLEGAITTRQVARSALLRSTTSLARDLASRWHNDEPDRGNTGSMPATTASPAIRLAAVGVPLAMADAAGDGHGDRCVTRWWDHGDN
jgi:hypothetical protein